MLNDLLIFQLSGCASWPSIRLILQKTVLTICTAPAIFHTVYLCVPFDSHDSYFCKHHHLLGACNLDRTCFLWRWNSVFKQLQSSNGKSMMEMRCMHIFFIVTFFALSIATVSWRLMNNYNFYRSVMNGVDCSSVMSYIYPIPIYGRITLTVVSSFEQF